MMVGAATYKDVYEEQFAALAKKLDAAYEFRCEMIDFIKAHGVDSLPAEHKARLPRDLRDLYKPCWRTDKKAIKTLVKTAKEMARNAIARDKMEEKFADNPDLTSLSWSQFAKKYDFDDYSPKDREKMSRNSKAMKIIYNKANADKKVVSVKQK